MVKDTIILPFAILNRRGRIATSTVVNLQKLPLYGMN